MADLLVKQAAVQVRALVPCEGFSAVVEVKQFWKDSVNVRRLIICLYWLCPMMIGWSVSRIVQLYHFFPGGTKHYLV